MSPRLRGLLADLGLACASLAVAALAAEAGLRLLGRPGAETLAARRIVAPDRTLTLDCYPTNPRGSFPLDLRRPENDARYRPLAPHRFDAIRRLHPFAVESRYNELRFREVAPAPKPPGRRRVAIVGDSFTEGQGVQEEDTVSRVLGRLLEAQAPGRFEVRNCGRRGANFPELDGVLEDALRDEPDVVVYALVLNDAEEAPGFRGRQEYVDDWIQDRTRAAGRAETAGPWRPRLFGLVSDRVRSWRLRRETIRWYLGLWSPANAGWAATRDRLRAWQRRLGERGTAFVVAPWPLLVDLEGRYPFAPVHETVRDFCRAERIPHHEMLEAFRGRRSRDLWVHPVDHHPNEVAHRLAAESLLPVVLDLAGR